MLTDGVRSLGGLLALVTGADRAIAAAGDPALCYGVSPCSVDVTLISVGAAPRR